MAVCVLTDRQELAQSLTFGKLGIVFGTWQLDDSNTGQATHHQGGFHIIDVELPVLLVLGKGLSAIPVEDEKPPPNRCPKAEKRGKPANPAKTRSKEAFYYVFPWVG